MSKLYEKLVQEYYFYQNEKIKLRKEYELIGTKLEAIEHTLYRLNDILCKSGKHIYEHFEEEEEREENDSPFAAD